MVICKFYRQGNCRYGQYCQFEHVNNYGNIKDFNNEDEIAVAVAKEVLLAERGGQWLLSCFAPIKERPIIPDMEDLSPEEVRWEMYQAQKSGMVEQAKLNFQQLCQNMKEKRDMLKNPNRETIAILKNLLGGQKGRLNASDNTAGKSSAFSHSAPQLGLANATPTNNIFEKQTFGVQSNNPFGGGFGSTSNTSLFGKSNNNTTSLFGGTQTFGNNPGFNTASNTNSIFGGTTNTPATFNNVQSAPAFGAVPPQTNSIFGGSPQNNVFGQSNIFGGATNQLTSQSTTSAFDSGSTSTTSLFSIPMTSQANTSLFGGTQTTTANLFGSTPGTQTNPVFGTTTSSTPFNIFSQPKPLPAFGGAPVFGGITNYANSPPSMFGATTQAFGTSAIPISNIFGSTTTTTPAFSAPVVTTTPAFGVVTTAPTFGGAAVITTPAFALGQQPAVNAFGTISAPNVFGTQNTGATIPASNNAPFGGSATITNPFVTPSSQFGSTSTTSTPFANAELGLTAVSTNDTFGNSAAFPNPVFANAGATFASSNPFSTSTFGNMNAVSPLGATNAVIATTTTTMTPTTTMANPFAPRTQQNSIPFGNVMQNQSTSAINASPFGKSPFTLTVTSTIINDSVYTSEGSLTDDEKSMYLADKFVIGKIPLKPPTKDVS